jgi:creatinine amidohydrolase/Fe(II)-dependent formamide hydrolase-like protein
MGEMDPRDATAAFGRETLEAAAEIAVREVRHRLEHKEMYRGHGNSLRERLWR